MPSVALHIEPDTLLAAIEPMRCSAFHWPRRAPPAAPVIKQLT